MRGAIAVVLGLLLGGCGAGSLTSAPADAIDLPLREVRAQRAVSGQCALALWTREAPARRLALVFDNPAVAHVNLAGRALALPRSGQRGEPIYGHPPEQTFAGDGVRLSLTTPFERRDGMVGGAVAPEALLTFTGTDGATTVLPVAGLVACQP